MQHFQDWNDTIVALATAQGVSAIGVIRVSGNQAIEIVNKIFTSKNLLSQPSHTLHVGYLKHENNVLDEVVVSLFKHPKSFTGEDVVEISCHGSPYIQQKIIHTLTILGARLAKPGEFTQRAFLHGKMDLVQAEAIADVIASNTEASKNAALHHMRGNFSKILAELREDLVKFSALIELELDFSQEDVEFADRSAFQQLIQHIKQVTQSLLHSFKLGNVIKQGVQTAIIGKPNAGKSTLLNALLNEERAIVSHIAGTTRDTIEESLNIDGILFKLIDTAGIREHTADEIEWIGVHKSMEKAQQADLIVYLFDAQQMDEDLPTIRNWIKNYQKPYLLVGNKVDTLTTDLPVNDDTIYISAKEQTNIQQLKQALFNKVVDGSISNESTIITNARHAEALEKLLTSVNDIQMGMEQHLPGDLLALDIRQAIFYLGTITGHVNNEEQLDYIFSKFCIGK